MLRVPPVPVPSQTATMSALFSDNPLWLNLFFAAEWVVRLAMLVIVPMRRSPEAAKGWLLLIFFEPSSVSCSTCLIGRPDAAGMALQRQSNSTSSRARTSSGSPASRTSSIPRSAPRSTARSRSPRISANCRSSAATARKSLRSTRRRRPDHRRHRRGARSRAPAVLHHRRRRDFGARGRRAAARGRCAASSAAYLPIRWDRGPISAACCPDSRQAASSPRNRCGSVSWRAPAGSTCAITASSSSSTAGSRTPDRRTSSTRRSSRGSTYEELNVRLTRAGRAGAAGGVRRGLVHRDRRIPGRCRAIFPAHVGGDVAAQVLPERPGLSAREQPAAHRVADPRRQPPHRDHDALSRPRRRADAGAADRCAARRRGDAGGSAADGPVPRRASRSARITTSSSAPAFGSAATASASCMRSTCRSTARSPGSARRTSISARSRSTQKSSCSATTRTSAPRLAVEQARYLKEGEMLELAAWRQRRAPVKFAENLARLLSPLL